MVCARSSARISANMPRTGAASRHVHREIEVPVYHQTGWYDRLIGAIDHYTAMVAQGRTEHARGNQKLIIGPWTHSSGGTRSAGRPGFRP